MKDQIKQLNNQDLDSAYQKLIENKKASNSNHNYLDHIQYSKLEIGNLNEKTNEEQTQHVKKKNGKGFNQKREKQIQESVVDVNKMKQLMIDRTPQFRHEIKAMPDDEIRNMFNSFNNTNPKQQKQKKNNREKPKSTIREANQQAIPSETISMENSIYSQRRIDEKGRSSSFQKNNDSVNLNYLAYSDGFADKRNGDKNSNFQNNWTNQQQKKFPQEHYQGYLNGNGSENTSQIQNPPKTIAEIKKLNKGIKKRIKCKLTLYLNQSDLEEGSDDKETEIQGFQSDKRLKAIKLQKIIRALHHTFQNGDWKLKEE